MKTVLKRALTAIGMDRLAVRAYMVANSRLRSLATLAGRDGRAIRDYLEHNEMVRVHLGCGYHLLAGWLNTDLKPRSWSAVRVDVLQQFPFSSNSVDFVFSEHLIEHLPYQSGEKVLEECFRVMKPDAVIRTATPDLAFVVGLYESEHPSYVREYLDFYRRVSYPWAPDPSETFFINNFVRDWDHQFIYDEKTLRRLLRSVGFVDVTRCDVGSSEHSDLDGLENVERMPTGYVALESMVLEARKPNPAEGSATNIRESPETFGGERRER